MLGTIYQIAPRLAKFVPIPGKLLWQNSYSRGFVAGGVVLARQSR